MEILDLAVIMGSSCQDVFLDMVRRYPGAQQFYNHVDSLPCECGDPHCSRRAMQGYLGEWFGDDKERIAFFFERLSSFDLTPSSQAIQTILADMGKIVGTLDEQALADHFSEMFRKAGIKFKRIDLN